MMGDRSRRNNSTNNLPADIPILASDGQYLSALHPKYLHTNSTSHTWPFSAVAELIDNAYDPDVDARQLSIDVRDLRGHRLLTLTDNGSGMMPDKLYKMVSFGFSEKIAVGDHHPVGQYGNGFKSGSMRLGRDALVFTKAETRWSLGFLSQSYLEKIKSNTIIVPFVTWDPKKFTLIGSESGGRKSLTQILEYSVVSTLSEIKDEFRYITGPTGTHIIISNLRKRGDGNKYELDFTTDSSDIRIPDDLADTDESRYKREQRQDHIPLSDYSLRAYCAILYLKPRMQIILRGKKVKTLVIAKSLAKTEVDLYTPTGYSRPVKITFGFSQNKNHYGIMMYNRNRLIKPYVRVGYQLKPNALGVGVIGVIECDFLQPTHNKQDFDQSKAFRACMAGLGRKLNEYWQEKKGASKSSSSSQQQITEEAESFLPDQKWVQCDNMKCLKWRILPDDTNLDSLPDKWYCKDHPLPEWRSCDIPEKLEDEQEIVTPYRKEVSKQLKKEQQQKRKQTETSVKRANELQQMVDKKEKELEEEKRRRTQNEARAKAREGEIQRLRLELQKKSENSNASVDTKTPTRSIGAASTTPKPTPRQIAAANDVLKANGTNLALLSRANPSSLVVIHRTNNKSLQSLSVPSPITNPVPSLSATPVTATAATRATRQSINQAMKLRLPFTTRRTAQAVTATESIATPKAATTVLTRPIVSPTVSAVVASPSQPLIQPKGQAAPGTTTTPTKTSAATPQVISLTGKNHISVTNTPSSSTGGPRVYRFVVTDPKLSGSLNKMKPSVTALALRPATPVHIANSTVVTTQPQPKVSPPSAVPKETTMTSKQLKSEPSSNAISHQLAQIGIDAIAAQAHDMVPSMAIATTVPSRQTSYMVDGEMTTRSQANVNSTLANGEVSGSTKTSPMLCTPGSKRKVIEVNDGDDDDSDDIQVIGAAKRVKREKKINENSNRRSDSEPNTSMNGRTESEVVEEDLQNTSLERTRNMLHQRSQQLRELRISICQLLGLLVPEINLPRPETMPLDDNTIDVLLRDVLDANRE